MTPRERLHTLVDDLPESEVRTATRFVEYLHQEASDPVAQALRDAPLDDEPLTEDDLAAIEEAKRDFREGRTLSHEEARRQLLSGSS